MNIVNACCPMFGFLQGDIPFSLLKVFSILVIPLTCMKVVYAFIYTFGFR